MRSFEQSFTPSDTLAGTKDGLVAWSFRPSRVFGGVEEEARPNVGCMSAPSGPWHGISGGPTGQESVPGLTGDWVRPVPRASTSPTFGPVPTLTGDWGLRGPRVAPFTPIGGQSGVSGGFMSALGEPPKSIYVSGIVVGQDSASDWQTKVPGTAVLAPIGSQSGCGQTFKVSSEAQNFAQEHTIWGWLALIKNLVLRDRSPISAVAVDLVEDPEVAGAPVVRLELRSSAPLSDLLSFDEELTGWICDNIPGPDRIHFSVRFDVE